MEKKDFHSSTLYMFEGIKRPTSGNTHSFVSESIGGNDNVYLNLLPLGPNSDIWTNNIFSVISLCSTVTVVVE